MLGRGGTEARYRPHRYLTSVVTVGEPDVVLEIRKPESPVVVRSWTLPLGVRGRAASLEVRLFLTEIDSLSAAGCHVARTTCSSCCRWRTAKSWATARVPCVVLSFPERRAHVAGVSRPGCRPRSELRRRRRRRGYRSAAAETGEGKIMPVAARQTYVALH